MSVCLPVSVSVCRSVCLCVSVRTCLCVLLLECVFNSTEYMFLRIHALCHSSLLSLTSGCCSIYLRFSFFLSSFRRSFSFSPPLLTTEESPNDAREEGSRGRGEEIVFWIFSLFFFFFFTRRGAEREGEGRGPEGGGVIGQSAAVWSRVFCGVSAGSISVSLGRRASSRWRVVSRVGGGGWNAERGRRADGRQGG